MADDDKKRTQEASETNFTTRGGRHRLPPDEGRGEARAAELDVTRLLAFPPIKNIPDIYSPVDHDATRLEIWVKQNGFFS